MNCFREAEKAFLFVLISGLLCIVSLNTYAQENKNIIKNYPLEVVRYIYYPKADDPKISDKRNILNKQYSKNNPQKTRKGKGGSVCTPVYCAQNSKGVIYISFSGDESEIQVFNPDGEFIFSFGKDSKGNSIFSNYICGLAINSRDEVFVADVKKREIFVFNHAGKQLYSFSSIQGLSLEDAKQNVYPAHIAIDKMDRVYISDGLNGQIYIHESQGDFLKKIRNSQSGLFPTAAHISFDSNDNIYILEGLGNCCIQACNPSGEPVKCIGKTGNSAGAFQRISGLAIDSKDRIFATDIVQNVIQIFNLNGDLIGIVKEVINNGKSQRLNSPINLFIGDKDIIYLIEQSQQRITVLKE